MKHQHIFIIFLISILISNCSKDCFEEYTFSLNYTLQPAQDTFYTGDTIWIESIIPTELENQVNNDLVDVKNINFPVFFSISQVDTNDFAPAERDFRFIPMKGELFFQELPGWTNVFLQYEKMENGQQQLRFGITTEKASTYLVSYHSLTRDLEVIDLSDCIEEVSLQYTTNNGIAEENNYHYIEQSNNPWVQVPKEAYETEGAYSFVVIE